MVNPASLMKLMKAKNQFGANHPKFMSFAKNVLGTGISEGTVVEITITKPGEAPVTTNLKVTQSDLDLFNELKDIAK